MRIQKLMSISCLLLTAFMFASSGCGQNKTKDDGQAIEVEKASNIEIVELKLGPVSTFERTCARCHGPQGAFYGDEFAKLNDGELHNKIRQMMVGPSFLKPKSHEVDAMTAYHRALTSKEPFLCVTSYVPNEQTNTASFFGETTPGSKIEFRSKNKEFSISPDEQGAWFISEAPTPPFKLVIKLSDKTREVNITESQWTHSVK